MQKHFVRTIFGVAEIIEKIIEKMFSENLKLLRNVFDLSYITILSIRPQINQREELFILKTIRPTVYDSQ